jgi:phosphomannomutase
MDADRLAVVSERGEPIGDFTLVLATWYVLGRQPGPVVANLSTTAALDEVARRFDCQVVRTKIGEANVTERMQRERAVIGGEGNGGVIYPAINFARDSQVVAAHPPPARPVWQNGVGLMADLQRFVHDQEKLTCPSNRIPDVLRMVRRDFAHLPMDTRDGVKVMLQGGWFHVRGSNTEPIVRVVAEAGSEADARTLVDDVFGRVARVVGGA